MSQSSLQDVFNQMSHNPSIVSAKTQDIEFLKNCAQRAYEIYVEAIGKEPAPMVFDFVARMQNFKIDIIRWDNLDAGYLVWDLRDDCLFLESIALLPEFQGKGLTNFALKHLEKQAMHNGRTKIELYTNVAMKENLTLYPHLGFVETGRAFEDGFNRVYFQKLL